MSFYSLWQHYISMTSQPLANSDRGVMRIVGNHRINASSPIVPALSPSLCHLLFAFVTLHPLKASHSIFFFLFLVATPPPLGVAFHFPFILCCLQLVPHLVRLKHHSLHHSLKSSLIFPTSVITPHQVIVPSFRNVCTSLSPPFFHAQT